MSNRNVVLAGFAGPVGGAGAESFETARMFCRRGLEVHMIPTWESPDPLRRKDVEALGVTVHCIKPPATGDLLRELGGPPVISFCNPGFLTQYRRFKEHSPTIWVNCMTSVSGEERAAWKKAGLPSAFLFQSEYQRRILENRLERHGYRAELGHLIRGALCWDAWEFAPLGREPGTPFVVGRAARPDPAKWSSHIFDALDPVPNVQAICLGADERVRRQLGHRKYAKILTPGAVPVPDFYRGLHAMICYNGNAKENWPRVGLEAMATGVPLVVDAQWGWPEMVRHGETGFLARRTSEFTECLQALEQDEELRLRIARQARQALEQELASPDAIWRGWCGIWRAVGAGHLCDATGPSPIQRIKPDLEFRRLLDNATERIVRENPLPASLVMEQQECCTIEQARLDVVPSQDEDQLATPPPEIELIPGEQIQAGDPLVSQRASDEALVGTTLPVQSVTKPPDREFIAGEDIKPNQPVCWKNGKIFGIPRPPLESIQISRPSGPCTHVEDVQDCAKHAIELLEQDTVDAEPRPVEIRVRPEDAHKLTANAQEQVASTTRAIDLQSRQENPTSQGPQS